MADRNEVEDQVNLDDDDFIAELDEELENQSEYEAIDREGNGHEEHELEEDAEELRNDDIGKEVLSQVDRSPVEKVEVEGTEDDKPAVSNVEVESEDAELLSLPARGSEDFVMAERTEVEDLEDLDDENYIAELDAELDGQSEHEAVEKEGNDHEEDLEEEAEDKDLRNDDIGKHVFAQLDRSPIEKVEVEGIEDDKPAVSNVEVENEEPAQLLSLPTRGSEDFVMAERTEVEDLLELDNDNYSDEVDEDLNDQSGYKAAEEKENGHDGNQQEADAEDKDFKSYDSGKKRLSQADRSPIDKVDVEGPEDNKPGPEDNKPAVSNVGLENEEHAKLLSLPPRGTEVFVGGLFRDVSEEDLRDLCEPFGEIFEIKLNKNKDTGESKGYAFVVFRTEEVAQRAVEGLHNKDFKGRTLRCTLCDAKYRLYIANIPKSWTEEQFRSVIEETGPGAVNIVLRKDPQNSNRNRGFAFVEYYNNACADYSRQKMSSDSFRMDGYSPSVRWADPKLAPDHSDAASQVKALYVKNIPENTSLEDLKNLFQRHGEVIKVVMPPGKVSGKRDFGFVSYAERSSALKAVKVTEPYEINGQVLEVTLAKPQVDRKFDNSIPFGSVFQPKNNANPGFVNWAMNPCAPAPPQTGFGAATGFQQPMIHGASPTPTPMQLVQVVLPDGRLGYVYQPAASQPMPQLTQPTQPPQQPQSQSQPHHRGRRHEWSSGERRRHGGYGRNYEDDSRSKRRRHY